MPPAMTRRPDEWGGGGAWGGGGGTGEVESGPAAAGSSKLQQGIGAKKGGGRPRDQKGVGQSPPPRPGFHAAHGISSQSDG